MVIKVYVSGISASPEIRSYQQRAQFILDSLRIDYESIDITDPGHEQLKDMIKEKCKHRNDQLPKTPQFFNEDIYCGDWFDFEIASDEDRVLDWLGLEDTREEEFEKLNMEAKIKGNDFVNNIDEVVNEKIDDTITTETITMEESIIIGKQKFKTAPFYLTSENENEIIQTKDFEREIEEEICMLEEGEYEIIKTEEEVISSSTRNMSLDNNEESNINEESNSNEENKMNEKSILDEHNIEDINENLNEINDDKDTKDDKDDENSEKDNYEENTKEDNDEDDTKQDNDDEDKNENNNDENEEN